VLDNQSPAQEIAGRIRSHLLRALPGAPKTLATLTAGRLVLEDTFKV
jgi:hypothetical protein